MILKRVKCYNYGILHNVDLEIPLGVTGILGRWQNSTKSNGSGKSTFVENIPWLLTNKIIGGGTQSDLIGNMDDNCFVEHWYDLGNHEVLRIKKGVHKTGDGFLEAGISYQGKKEIPINEGVSTKQRLERLHGFDSDMLLATAFFQQAEHDTFTKKAKATKRKEYIRKVRGVSIFDGCYEDVKLRKKPHEDLLVKIQNQIDSAKDDLHRIILEDEYKDNFQTRIKEVKNLITQNKSNLESARKERDVFISKNAIVEEIKKQITDLENSIVEIRKQETFLKEKIHSTTEKRNEIEKNFFKKFSDDSNQKEIKTITLKEDFFKKASTIIQKKIETIDAEINSLIERIENFEISLQYEKDKIEYIKPPISIQPEIEKSNNLLQELSNKIAVIDAEKISIERKIANYKTLKESMPCPTCSKILTSEEKLIHLEKLKIELNEKLKNKNEVEKLKHSEQLKKENLEKNEKEITQKKEEIRNVNQKITTLTQSIKITKQLLNSKGEEKKQTEQSNQHFKEAFLKTKETIETLTSSISADEKTNKTYITQIQEVEIKKTEKQKEITIDYTDTINDLNNQISEKENQIKTYTEQIETYKHKQNQKKEIEEKIENYNTELTKITAILENYSRISFTFSKNGVSNSFVEETVFEMQDLANKYLWQIDPTKSISFKTKSDSGKDTLDILVLDRDKLRIYERYSGGEKTTINLSIRLALSNILNKRAVKKMGLIVLDEVFGQLCDYNRPLVVQLINQIRNSFSQIFVISHSDMKDQFENLIMVERFENYSTVRRIR